MPADTTLCTDARNVRSPRSAFCSVLLVSLQPLAAFLLAAFWARFSALVVAAVAALLL